MTHIRKIKAGGVNTSLDNFVGEKGILFYDVETGELRISDGHTPGGQPVIGGEGGGSVDWLNVPSSILPDANVTHDLGSPTRQWNSLYVSSTTIYFNNVPLTINNEGDLFINGSQFTGPQGPQGEQGTQGPVGPQGSTGTQGIQGIQGIQGPIGTTGTTGAQGIQGIQGIQGTQGIQGPIGNTGTQGPIGNTGTQGIQGIQGLQGIQGPIGNTGTQGIQGPTGNTGAQGISVTLVGSTSTSTELPGAGNPGDGWIVLDSGHLYFWNTVQSAWNDIGPIVGPEGPRGLQGVKGDTGSQGPVGNTGTQGAQGIQGIQGIQGVKGDTGAQGPQGPAGPQGTTGTTGAQGPQGIQGIQGIQGSTGTQGIQGLQGLQGPQGDEGPAGPQGDEGPAGPAGDDGVSASINYQGAWSDTESYVKDDAVYYNGSSYLATVTVMPGGSAPPDMTSSWQLLAEKGADGGNANTGNFVFTGNEMSVIDNDDITVITNANTWTFGADGLLAFPNGTTIGPYTGTTAGIDIKATGENDFVELNYNDDQYIWVDKSGAYIGTSFTATNYTWQFDKTGTITLPADGVIKSADSVNINVVDSNAATLESAYNDKVTELTDAFAAEEWTGAGYPVGPNSPRALTLAKAMNPLIPDEWITIGTELQAAYDAWQAALDGKQWTFDRNGVITLPGGNTRIGDVYGAGNDAIVGSTGTAVGVLSEGTGGYVALQWIDNIENIGTTSTQVAAVVVNSPIASTTGTVQIVTGATTSTGIGSNIWEFGNTGTLTLPNGTAIGSFDGPNGIELKAFAQHDYVELSYNSDQYLWADASGAYIATNYTATGHIWTFAKDGVMSTPGHLIPNTDLAYDLGSTSSQWRSIYVGTGTIYIGGVAIGVSNDNYVTVDGNPIITVNTTGNLTIQGDTNIVLGAVVISDTAPAATTPGSQWYNSVDGRTYVSYNGAWVDSSPAVVPTPETYLDEITIDGSTLNINGGTLTIDDSGKLLVNGSRVVPDVYGASLTASATDPMTSTGTLWFNTVEGRTYLKYNNQWVDVNPTVVPLPSTYLDEITIDGSTINMNGSTLTINTSGTLLVNGSEVTGSGGGGDRLTTGSYSIILGTNGIVTFPVIDGTKTLWGAVDEDFTIKTTRTDPGSDADINIYAADDIWIEANGDDIVLTAADEVRIESNAANSTYEWTFRADGNLILPLNGRIQAIGDVSSAMLQWLPTDGNGSTSTSVYVSSTGVQIVTDAPSNENTWLFGTDGSTTFPNDTILGTGQDPNVYIETSTTATTSTWTFGTNGILTLPATTPVIKGGGTGTDVTVIASTGSNTSTWTFAADGSLTLPMGAKLKEYNITDGAFYYSKVSALQAIESAAGEVVTLVTRGDGYSQLAWIGTDSLASLNGADISCSYTSVNPAPYSRILTTGYGAWIENRDSTGTDYRWTFGPDGGLTFPDSTLQTTAWTGETGELIGDGAAAPVGSTQTIADDGSGGLVGWSSQALSIAYDPNVISTYPVGSTITWQDGTTATITQWDDYGPTYIDLFWDTPKSGTLFPIILKTADYVASVENTARVVVTTGTNTSTWTFDAGGGLTFPDTTVQTTAWNDQAFHSAMSTYDGEIITNTATIGVGGLTVNGPVTFNSTFTFLGTATIINSNSGTFYGDVQGVGALYAGVAGFSPLPSTVIQSAANVNAYIQNNFQNINNGVQASTEWVATANNGDDSNHYLDMGIAGSAWDGSQSNSVGTAASANDSWIYAQGSTSTANGGNLILGTIKNGKSVKILTGSTGSSSIVATFHGRNTAASSTNTGALQVIGGIGVSGASYFGSNITVNGGFIYGPSGGGSIQISGGYLYVSSLAVNGTGNIAGPGGTIAMVLGGGAGGGQSVKFNSTASIVGTTAATSTNTGALQVAGGAGIAGDVYVGGTVTATANAGTTSTTAAGLGYIGMPQNSTATSYTLVAGDQGKHVYVSATGQTITVPANATTPFPVGTTIAVIAGPSATTATIAITSDTMYLGGTGSTGTRTLAAYGMATLVKVAATTWFINGTGLT